MSLLQAFSYYYGRLTNPLNINSLADDILKEQESMMMQEMKEMEDRLKRHVTECKREVIKEVRAIFTDPKPYIKPKKESKNGK